LDRRDEAAPVRALRTRPGLDRELDSAIGAVPVIKIERTLPKEYPF